MLRNEENVRKESAKRNPFVTQNCLGPAGPSLSFPFGLQHSIVLHGLFNFNATLKLNCLLNVPKTTRVRHGLMSTTGIACLCDTIHRNNCIAIVCIAITRFGHIRNDVVHNTGGQLVGIREAYKAVNNTKWCRLQHTVGRVHWQRRSQQSKGSQQEGNDVVGKSVHEDEQTEACEVPNGTLGTSACLLM